MNSDSLQKRGGAIAPDVDDTCNGAPGRGDSVMSPAPGFFVGSDERRGRRMSAAVHAGLSPGRRSSEPARF